MAAEEREKNNSQKDDTESVGADDNMLPNSSDLKLLGRSSSKNRSTQQLYPIDNSIMHANGKIHDKHHSPVLKDNGQLDGSSSQ